MNNKVSPSDGLEMYALSERLFPICRSITGDGVRQSHAILREYIPDLVTHEVPTGTECLDWVVPDEWNVRDGYILGQDHEKIVDFQRNNLHVLGYSEPIDREVSLEELQTHLFSLPETPDVIPYATSYYKRTWGFCLTENQRRALTNSKYRVVIDSDLSPGSLTYSELYVPGRSEQEVMLSSYTCHPSMANNEISGPVVATFLAAWLSEQDHHYSYRLVLAPETIGPIVYLSKHLRTLKKNVIAALNLTCVGDDRSWSFMPSRKGDTLSDRVARHVLQHLATEYREWDFLEHRGSDERQYCSPGVDLPMVSIMRSRYGSFPEYHTSADDLTVISPTGLQGSLDMHKAYIKLIEANRTYSATVLGEPQLSRRGILSQIGGGTTVLEKRKWIQNFLMCCDGGSDFLQIAESMGVYSGELEPIVNLLLEQGLIKETKCPRD
jgi:aminopeptidase-like protein